MTAREFNWGPGLFIIGYHIALAIMLPLYFMYYTPSLGLILASIVLFFATGLSITAGYHRYYSHTTYKTVPLVEFFLLFFGSMATQGSALRWSFDHRIHHAFVDTDRDPYSINKGFWFAHILWLFRKPNPIDTKVVADLTRNKLVMFQHKYFEILLFLTNFIAFAVTGWLLNDYIGAFVLALWGRIFFLHHCTWFINSLAHTWGARTFSKEQTACDNYFISLLTFGEGYHNYHHTFANDYRNGIKWYHFDPTKWVIWTLGKLNLARNLKKVDHYHIKERIVVDRKNELLEKLTTSFSHQKDELIQHVSMLSEKMLATIGRIKELLHCEKSYHEVRNLNKSFKEDWKQLKKLSRSINRLEA